jgi:hypothetical protein
MTAIQAFNRQAGIVFCATLNDTSPIYYVSDLMGNLIASARLPTALMEFTYLLIPVIAAFALNSHLSTKWFLDHGETSEHIPYLGILAV